MQRLLMMLLLGLALANLILGAGVTRREDWFKGQYLTALENPNNQCEDGKWGFVKYAGIMYTADHKICDLKLMENNFLNTRYYPSTNATLDKRIPNPVVISGSATLIGGSEVTGSITLGTVASVAAIGIAIGATIVGFKSLIKVIDSVSSRDIQNSTNTKSIKRVIDIPMFKRGTQNVGVCVSGDNDDETAAEEYDSDRDVDNMIATQCVQDANTDNMAGGCCELGYTNQDQSTVSPGAMCAYDTEVDYANVCCQYIEC